VRKRRSDAFRHAQRTPTAKMDIIRFLVARPSRVHK
jgi:hypothetical protein